MHEFGFHPGKYTWRSLKTTDEANAIREGRRLLFHLEQRVEVGLPVKSKLFSVVIDDYVEFRERDHRQGRTSVGMLRQIVRVVKFWREYAGELPIEAIEDKAMREFIPWRRGLSRTLFSSARCRENFCSQEQSRRRKVSERVDPVRYFLYLFGLIVKDLFPFPLGFC